MLRHALPVLAVLVCAADARLQAAPDTDTMYVVWTVHVDPGPPWNLDQATFEQGCFFLDEMAAVFEAHGLEVYVAVSWNFNDASQTWDPTGATPGSVADLAARGHDIGLHQHQGASIQDQHDGLTALAGTPPVCFDGIPDDIDELIALGYQVGGGGGKDVSTQLATNSTRSYRPDVDDPFVEDPDGVLLGFQGGSFEGQAYEPDETANMTIALDYDIARMVPGKMHSFTIVTHPDEAIGKSDAQYLADMARIDAWLTADIDPRIASGQITWTTKRDFELLYTQWEDAGGDNDGLFGGSPGVTKPGWSVLDASTSDIVSDEIASIAVMPDGTLWFGAGSITGGGLSRLSGGTWATFTSQPGGMLSDKPLFLAPTSGGGVRATMATEPTLPGILGLSTFDGASWANAPASLMGFGGSPGFLWEAAEDANGWVWVGTGQGVARLAGGNWTAFIPAGSPLSDDRVYRVAVAPNGDKWFGTLGGGIDVLDDNGTIPLVDDVWTNHDQPDLPAGTVRALAFDAAGRAWAGTQRGAAVYDGVSWTIFDETSSGLVHDHVVDVHVDSRGDVWFATYGHGASRYRPSTGLWDSYGPTTGEMLRGHLLDVDEDVDSDLLFAGYHGGGVTVFEQRLVYDAPPVIGEDFTLRVGGDPGDGVWLLLGADEADLPAGAAGTLLLDPSTLLVLPLGPIPAGGTLVLTVPIPNDPALVGTTPLFMQALTYASLGPVVGELTNRQSFLFLP